MLAAAGSLLGGTESGVTGTTEPDVANPTCAPKKRWAGPLRVTGAAGRPHRVSRSRGSGVSASESTVTMKA
ncbi:hypothetical protein LBMAG15_02260 [Actinomycetes bacterium]|nr:hypothetical protein LBMAG15_02260 [Actinomycetes bacterium]